MAPRRWRRWTNSRNELVASYLAKTHTPGASNCSGNQFSKSLLNCIDANGNSGLCTGELIVGAQALKLKIGGTPSDAGRCAGTSGGKACTKAKAALKKARKALNKAKTALNRAKARGRKAKIAQAKKGVRRAEKQVKNAQKKVKGACG